MYQIKKKKDPIKVNLPSTIGKGYGAFWKYKGRYRVVKGSRASKKSTTTALWLITTMMKYPQANALVVRKVFRTLKDSCFAQLKWATVKLGVKDLWQFKESPLEAVYIPTGQHIFFRGLDDPLKVTSITVEDGYLCFCWIEEAYEIMDETSFDMLDESIRGEVQEPLFKQITITLNPWNERHWIKKRFFDEEKEDVLALTTNYQCNEWLDEDDLKVFEDMRVRNPRRYRTAGLGDWGVVDGLVFENWKEQYFTLKQMETFIPVNGLDWGYTNDPTAVFIGFYDKHNGRLYVWDEIYQKGLSNRSIKDEIVNAGYGSARFVADSAEPKSIAELNGLGLHVRAAKKGRDSINNGIQFIQDLEIIIHPRCVNFLTEISNYQWAKDKFGKKLNVPIDDFNHLQDAMRYAMEEHITSCRVKLKTYKL